MSGRVSNAPIQYPDWTRRFTSSYLLRAAAAANFRAHTQVRPYS